MSFAIESALMCADVAAPPTAFEQLRIFRRHARALELHAFFQHRDATGVPGSGVLVGPGLCDVFSGRLGSCPGWALTPPTIVPFIQTPALKPCAPACTRAHPASVARTRVSFPCRAPFVDPRSQGNQPTG